jgi:transcriptional regulator with XRE-family HTH domain
MMTIGEKIKAARARCGMTGEELGRHVGITKAAISQIETDKRQQVDLDTLCKIADALNDISILTHHCQTCPVRKMAFIKQFPELNNIRHDPAIVTNKLRIELEEAASALNHFSELLMDADFRSKPGYMEEFEKAMEQVIDAERAIEILKFELILSETHSSLDIQRVYARQQAKCVAHGHHKPEQDQDKAAA